MTQNYFELFGLKPQFSIDLAVLEAKFRKIQAEVHPDKFVTATATEKLKSMQTATFANEAYASLKSAAYRANYLLSLQGIDALAEKNTAMPVDFLMQQLEWREQLDDAQIEKNIKALDALAGALKIEAAKLQACFEQAFDMDSNFQLATELARKLTFIDKVRLDVHKAIEQLD